MCKGINGNTPLGIASQYGNLEVIKCLVPFEDNDNLEDAINTARLFAHYDVAEYLTRNIRYPPTARSDNFEKIIPFFNSYGQKIEQNFYLIS